MSAGTVSAREVVALIAQRAELPRQDVDRMLMALSEVTLESLGTGQRVRLPGLGSIKPVQRASRLYRDITSGAQRVARPKRYARLVLTSEASLAIQPEVRHG